MANKFEMFRKIQFSIFLLASSHIPAQAVDDTSASQTGTLDGVKFLSSSYKISQPPIEMDKLTSQSFLPDQEITTSGPCLFFAQ